MRGFRASRAAVNFKSTRFGHIKAVPTHPYNENEPHGEGQSQHVHKELPAWLKMPAPRKMKRKKAA